MTDPMTPTPSTGDGLIERLAMRFHETYERLAPQFHYTTRKASAVPWRDVPEANRRLMIATVAEIIPDTIQTLQTERARLYSRLVETQVLASRWMEAHDKLQAGEPYSFPSLADVPDLQTERDALRTALEHICFYHGPDHRVTEIASAALNSNPNTSGEAK